MDLRKKDYFSIGFYLILAILVFNISGIVTVLTYSLEIILYIIIFYALYFFIKKIFGNKKIISSKQFAFNFLFSLSIILIFLFGIIGSFSYYYNEKSPAYMVEYTLSNGQKTVVFQSMVHIAGEKFYQNISDNLDKYKSDGFVHFFEGVGSGSEENMANFNKALGVKFSEELYENMSKLYGATAQDYEKIIKNFGESDINVDINIDEIMEKYRDLVPTSTQNNEINPIDLEKSLNEIVNRLNSKELKILVYMNKALLNFIIGNEGNYALTSQIESNKIFDVILGERNKVVAEKIISSDFDKIYVTYGGLHFDGIFALLKENDSNWEIVKEEKVRVLE